MRVQWPFEYHPEILWNDVVRNLWKWVMFTRNNYHFHNKACIVW